MTDFVQVVALIIASLCLVFAIGILIITIREHYGNRGK